MPKQDTAAYPDASTREQAVQILTTVPVNGWEQRIDNFKTGDLICRPLEDSDFDAFAELLENSEMMTQAGLGPMINDEAWSWFKQTSKQARLGIFLESGKSEAKLIGEGGVVRLENEWPQPYMFLHPEYQRRGYAQQFGREFLKIWWSLPRKPELEPLLVQPEYLRENEKAGSVVVERLCASIPATNEKSNPFVKTKGGFEDCGTYMKKIQVLDKNDPKKETMVSSPHRFWRLEMPQEYWSHGSNKAQNAVQ